MGFNDFKIANQLRIAIFIIFFMVLLLGGISWYQGQHPVEAYTKSLRPSAESQTGSKRAGNRHLCPQQKYEEIYTGKHNRKEAKYFTKS